MAFRSSNIAAHMIKFNSAASADFLDLYSSIVEEEIVGRNSRPKHQTFAPSQMRCDLVSWFRLRGTQPDKVNDPDKTLDFSAQVGTACHETIQKRLINKLEEDWIPVSKWVSMNPEWFDNFDMDITEKGYESLIDMKKPYPVRFACDGIINFDDKIRLLEIKTAEFSSLNDLTEPKPKHMDQIKCYSTLLHIPNVLFLYQERQYGGTKCFEVKVSESDWNSVKSKMDNVLNLVEANIAPEGLPKGDPDCTPNMCDYYQVCKQWRR